jgi:hypothetical protein
MDRLIPTLIVVVVLAAVLVLMLVSWRARARHGASLGDVAAPPEELGTVLTTARGLYLATTPAGQPLERIAAPGLAFRARTTVTVADAGIVLPIPGERDLFLPTSTLSEVSSASWTIDRGIEPGGIVRLGWRLGSTPVESYFRFDDDHEFVPAVRGLISDRKEAV